MQTATAARRWTDVRADPAVDRARCCGTCRDELRNNSDAFLEHRRPSLTRANAGKLAFCRDGGCVTGRAVPPGSRVARVGPAVLAGRGRAGRATAGRLDGGLLVGALAPTHWCGVWWARRRGPHAGEPGMQVEKGRAGRVRGPASLPPGAAGWAVGQALRGRLGGGGLAVSLPRRATAVVPGSAAHDSAVRALARSVPVRNLDRRSPWRLPFGPGQDRSASLVPGDFDGRCSYRGTRPGQSSAPPEQPMRPVSPRSAVGQAPRAPEYSLLSRSTQCRRIVRTLDLARKAGGARCRRVGSGLHCPP